MTPARTAAPADRVPASAARTLTAAGGRISLRTRPRTLLVCGLLLTAAAAVGVLAIGTGDYPLSPLDVLRTLAGGGPPGADFVVTDIRLPRLLTGLLVGAALGVSGAVFQSLSRNPLGSPDIVGFTTGSASGGLLAIIVLGGGTALVPFGAIAGGLATAAAVHLLTRRGGGAHGYRLVLTGIGVSAVLGAVNSYLLTRANLNEAQQAVVWLAGSLNGRGWEHVVPVAIALAVLLPATAALARPLSLLEMGDDAALGLGVPVARTRLALLVAAVALAAVATAAAGPVPFVALAAPQLARRLTRDPGPNLLPAAFMGALLAVAADYLAQRLLGGRELPVGIMTAAVGGIYLLWLLTRERRP